MRAAVAAAASALRASAAWVAVSIAVSVAVPLVVGNGFTAAMTHTGTMHVGACVSINIFVVRRNKSGRGGLTNTCLSCTAGVFNGDLDKGRAPARADIPSFWDDYEIEGYQGDGAQALDVGV